MQSDRLVGLNQKLSSLAHASLPMLAPFCVQAACASYLLQVLPISIAIGTGIGLFISHLFGPIGFFMAAASWGTFLILQYPDLLQNHMHLLFFASSLVSWWLSTLCGEQYHQKVRELEGIVSSLFTKNVDLQKTASASQEVVKEEKKKQERQVIEFGSLIQDLQTQVSSHRHHLHLAWKELSVLKEERGREYKELLLHYEQAENKCALYLGGKQLSENAVQQLQQELDLMRQDREARQKQFLDDFSLLQVELEERNLTHAQLVLELQEVKATIEKEPASAELVSMASQEQSLYWEALYKQLRRQFDEKSVVLSGTRRELFLVENQLLTMKKAQQEQSMEESDDQKSLISHLNQLDLACCELEEEVLFLQDIVTSLQDKKQKASLKKGRVSAQGSNPLEELRKPSAPQEISLFSI